MEKNLVILNESGMHARPAGIFMKEANKFKADIEIEAKGKKINGKSIMGIMSLGLAKGTEIIIRANGEDAEEAINALVELMENKFGE